jgi:hypothetical protein
MRNLSLVILFLFILNGGWIFDQPQQELWVFCIDAWHALGWSQSLTSLGKVA